MFNNPNKRTKKSINDARAYPDLSAEEILLRIKAAPNNRGQQAFLACLWLFGNRVSELLGIPPRETVGYYEYKRVSKKKKNATVKILKYRYLNDEVDNIDKWEVVPVTRVKAQVDPETNSVFLKAQTLKREGRPYHDYRAILDLPEEREAWGILTEYLATKSGLEPLWSFRRSTGWSYCDKYLGVPPHKLRGLRATRDAVKYGLDAIDLKAKYNWSDPGMAFHYASKNPRNLVDKMRKNVSEPIHR